MCGITGLLAASARHDGETVVRAMADAIAHRGPDAHGVWADREAGVALGHRRLSILDLSPAGAQPMTSASGRWVVVYNGEIYNHAELRAQLSALGHAFRGTSDTEVMLAAFDRWGIPRTLERLVGMFAFACWDRDEQKLFVARDRAGEKPLYYGESGGVFLFGSELKALRAHPDFRPEIDRDALSLFFRYNNVPSPLSIYRGIRKLPPGTWLSVRRGQAPSAPVAYWSPRKAAEVALAEGWQGTEKDALDAVESLLRDVVRRQMVADVPLGAFLSGGIDSSLVVALMQAESSRPVRTFTIGFAEAAYDESPQAKAIAAHLRTEHTELRVTPADAMAIIPKLPTLYDEPFADSSQIPTLLVAQLARKHVTVALTGDGGDEIFAGYNRHAWGPRVWRRVGWMPAPARAAASRVLTAVSPRAWDRAYGKLGPALPRRFRMRLPGDKLHKLAGVLPAASPEALHRMLASQWQKPDSLVLGGHEPPLPSVQDAGAAQLPDLTARMMLLDYMSYMSDDVLVKVDRAAMGVSLETRAPYLDHRLYELAWRLPADVKLRAGEGKWALKRVLERHVPRALFDRPKMGFGLPIDTWLRGPLRDWAEALMDPARLRTEGYLNPGPIQARWRDHVTGRASFQHLIWCVLMFQSWLQEHG